MVGNAQEWTADWYDSQYYGQSPDSDPSGPTSGDSRVARGGSWSGFLEHQRSSSRFALGPGEGDVRIGFRCAAGEVFP